MKTMFLSYDGINNCSKKKFQKPNILRRNTKGPTVKANVPRSLETSVSTIQQENLTISHLGNVETSSKAYLLPPIKITECQKDEAKPAESTFSNKDTINTALEESLVSSDHEENVTNGSVINVEAFLNDSSLVQSTSLLEEHNLLNSSLIKRDWCYDLINEAQQIIIEDPDGSELASLHAADDSAVECVSVSIIEPLVELDEKSPAENVVPVDLVATPDDDRTFECGIPGCYKSFKSKEQLRRHRRKHLPQTPKEPRHITVECPARKPGTKDEACGKIFIIREALTKHMQEDHSLDDAMYICKVCGRRFFWCMGLRAHSRAHLTRAAPKRALACQWPGCGRVFHLPCRLREHLRSHTGDKPYPCSYPNCNWSFRTASKLLRHARRHTGERRHACALCGHAFPRREHLRKHTATHHALMNHCNHPGCQRRFVSVDALARHLRNRHKRELYSDDIISAQSDMEQMNIAKPYIEQKNIAKPDMEWRDMFRGMVPIKSTTDSSKSNTTSTGTSDTPKPTKKRNVRPKVKIEANTKQAKAGVAKRKPDQKSETVEEEESNWNLNKDSMEWHVYETEEVDMGVDETVEWHTLTEAAGVDSSDWRPSTVEDLGADGNGEWHAARTHCTWPLAPRPTEDTLEDVQVELSEGSESNTYTIRSDLFLHGNLLTNEDSEHIPRASAVPDSGLSMMDAHPTVGLLQEDLLYTDAAVDESSFRVFLLSGEELV